MQPQKIPVLKRLIPSVRKRAVRLIWPDGQGVVRREGALFLLNLKNCRDRGIFLRGVDEVVQRTFFFDAVRNPSCDMFLDVGSNIGVYAVLAGLQNLCPTIIAYEPDPRCYDKLRIHLLLNGLIEKVATRNAAASDRNGTVPFAPAPDNEDFLSKVSEGQNSIPVPAIRLDDEITVSGKRIALKIDVEGHEMAVLDGMKSLLRNNDCFLQIECWSQNAGQFVEAMKAEGYECLHNIHDDYYFAWAKT